MAHVARLLGNCGQLPCLMKCSFLEQAAPPQQTPRILANAYCLIWSSVNIPQLDHGTKIAFTQSHTTAEEFYVLQS